MTAVTDDGACRRSAGPRLPARPILGASGGRCVGRDDEGVPDPDDLADEQQQAHGAEQHRSDAASLVCRCSGQGQAQWEGEQQVPHDSRGRAGADQDEQRVHPAPRADGRAPELPARVPHDSPEQPGGRQQQDEQHGRHRPERSEPPERVGVERAGHSAHAAPIAPQQEPGRCRPDQRPDRRHEDEHRRGNEVPCRRAALTPPAVERDHRCDDRQWWSDDAHEGEGEHERDGSPPPAAAHETEDHDDEEESQALAVRDPQQGRRTKKLVVATPTTAAQEPIRARTSR